MRTGRTFIISQPEQARSSIQEHEGIEVGKGWRGVRTESCERDIGDSVRDEEWGLVEGGVGEGQGQKSDTNEII